MNKMFRLTMALVIIALAFAGFATAKPAFAAMDPKTFYVSWPYTAPPAGNLNMYSPDSLVNSFPYSYLVTPTFGYYLWSKGEWKGWLAEKWGFSEDGKKYVITLRDGLTWSDGSPLTTKDVISTYNVLLDTGGNGEYTFGVESVVAVDERTVEFNLNKPPSLILERLILKEAVSPAAMYGQFADKFAKLVEEGTKAGTALADIKKSDAWVAADKELVDFRPETHLASGPYTLDLKDVTEAQLIMRRTDKTYFGKMAKFENVVVYKGDTEVVTPLFLSGDINYSTDYFPPATEQSLVEKGVRILRAPSYGGPALYFNHAVYPLNRVEVRKAIAYAIDRARATSVAYGDIGKPVKYMAGFSDSELPLWTTPGTVDKLETYDYNLDKAAELLTSIGFKKEGDVWMDDKGNPMEFELSAPADFTDWMPAAQDVVDQLNAFGIKVTLRATPNAQHVPEVKEGKFQLAIRLWGFPNPFPFYAFRNMYQRNAVGRAGDFPGMSYATKQTIGGKEVDFDKLVSDMSTGTDVEAQKVFVTEAVQAFNADLPLVPLIERFYNTPLIDTNVANMPAEGDPIYGNVSGSDNIIVVLLMEGMISPK